MTKTIEAAMGGGSESAAIGDKIADHLPRRAELATVRQSAGWHLVRQWYNSATWRTYGALDAFEVSLTSAALVSIHPSYMPYYALKRGRAL